MHLFVWPSVILLILWAVLWLGFKIVGGLVHLIVLAAAVLIIWELVKKGASAVSNRM